MATALALLAAFLFALAAALQQKGALNLLEVSLRHHPASLTRLSMGAAVYGTIAGVLFGLCAALTKPNLGYLHDGIGDLLSHWEPYALALAGVLGFALRQVSLGVLKEVGRRSCRRTRSSFAARCG